MEKKWYKTWGTQPNLSLAWHHSASETTTQRRCSAVAASYTLLIAMSHRCELSPAQGATLPSGHKPEQRKHRQLQKTPIVQNPNKQDIYTHILCLPLIFFLL